MNIKRSTIWLGSCLALSANACGGAPNDGDIASTSAALSAAASVDRQALALRWAPVHRQDVDVTDISAGKHSLSGRSDYITRVDFDGDWNGKNNWDNTSKFSLPGYAYHSVVETGSHWFVVYDFFHPRDWTDIPFDQEHENDSEGLMAIVKRDGSTYGQLEAVVTVAHTDFFSYVPAGGAYRANNENIDGTLPFETVDGSAHPVTAAESKGHGLKVPPAYDIDGDGLVYYPSATSAEVPESANDRHVDYKLIDMFGADGLWSRRNDTGLFASYGTFAGDTGGGCGGFPITCKSNSANAPWGWDDHDDGPARGELATDPAHLTADYFVIPGAFERTYTYNPYAGIGLSATVASGQ